MPVNVNWDKTINPEDKDTYILIVEQIHGNNTSTTIYFDKEEVKIILKEILKEINA